MVWGGLTKTPTPPSKVFKITLPGNKKTSELIKLGRYDWVNGAITDERFPIVPHPSQTHRIELIEFDHDPTTKEVIKEFKRRGLTRPVVEDALAFGTRHRKEQRGRPVVFLHKPVQGDVSSCLFILSLYEVSGGRILFMDLFAGRWRRGLVFAGVRK